MLLSTRIYGATAVNQVKERIDSPVLVAGRDRITRSELANVACFSFVAAHNLSTILAALRIESLAHLYKDYSPYDLAIPRLGVVSLMVLGAAFEVRGLGTIESWAERHREKRKEDHLVTFASLKHHHEAEKPARAKRRARRT